MTTEEKILAEFQDFAKNALNEARENFKTPEAGIKRVFDFSKYDLKTPDSVTIEDVTPEGY